MPNIFFFLLIAVVGIEFRPIFCQNTRIKVAVADYKPLRHYRDIEQAVIKRNINQYIHLIETASNKGVNLTVFPEYGLTTDECLDSYFPHVYGIELENHLNKVLCLNQKDVNDNIIKLSCAAITNHMHIVVNLIEDKNETLFFSTVYFDDEGALKKIYRKQYITDKHQKYSPGDDDVAIIETKLGNFSLMSGLDLLLPKSLHKNNIDKIILTSSVQSQYPFLYGPSLFTGYSKTTNKTLIVSSLNLKDYDGSGIYDSKVRYFYEEDLIIADIPLNNIYNQREQKRSKRNTLEISYDFENYDHCLHDLDTPTSHCNISVTFQDNIERLSYKKATCLNNNKLRDMTNPSLCALVYCPDKICKTRFSETINIKEIKISMTNTNGSVVQPIPISLTADYSTIENFEYRKEEKHYYLSSKNEENKVISFGILLTAIEQDFPINNNNITEKVDRNEDLSKPKNEGNAFISNFNTIGILLFIICLGYIC